ncbi:MAG: sialate O-acetylesterase [Ginsengibacter sp.]
MILKAFNFMYIAARWKKQRRMRGTAFLLSLFVFSAPAQVRLPKLVSDGMVLQRDAKLMIWGWATPGEPVTVEFNNNSYYTKTNAVGKWAVQIKSQRAGGPYQMTINASNEIILKNILVGDVWVCSGQSNMELMMARVKYKYPEEITNANNSNIRQFTVPDKYNFNAAQSDLEGGTWIDVSAKNILSFSAVGYFFAKEIYARYGVPVGLINAALGGSPAEAWISEKALKRFPAFYEDLQKFKDTNLVKEIESRDRIISSKWHDGLNDLDDGLKNNWKNSNINDSGWTSFQLPGYWADTNAGLFNGSAWFRKEFELPQSMTGKTIKIELGRIADADSVFINEEFVGTTGYQYPPRIYEVPPGILKPGANTIVIRVISENGRGGFVPGKPYRITSGNDTIDLKGMWKFKPGVAVSALPGQTVIRWKPAGLFNAMIAPLSQYVIKGAIWYQGEANASRPTNYKALMETLISNWRDVWRQGNFPFIYVQLANFMETSLTPAESSWAELRQQQLKTLSVPNTAMAVAIDLGEWNDIHPLNKKEVGRRLALLAQKVAYHDNTSVTSGPLYHTVEIHGNKIVVKFSQTGSGLRIKDNVQLKQFAIAGKNKKYVWAQAVIKGNTVVVWNTSVKNPVTVRYAWADNPEGANLYNKDGLPASPFETGK